MSETYGGNNKKVNKDLSSYIEAPESIQLSAKEEKKAFVEDVKTLRKLLSEKKSEFEYRENNENIYTIDGKQYEITYYPLTLDPADQEVITITQLDVDEGKVAMSIEIGFAKVLFEEPYIKFYNPEIEEALDFAYNHDMSGKEKVMYVTTVCKISISQFMYYMDNEVFNKAELGVFGDGKEMYKNKKNRLFLAKALNLIQEASNQEDTKKKNDIKKDYGEIDKF